MSEAALVETIRVELRQRRAMGKEYALLTPGNYGSDFIRQNLDVDLNTAVQVSNFLGDALDICRALGFRGALLVGHVGKLVKTAGGMMNTHSKYGDCRMEILAAHAAAAGVEHLLLPGIDSESHGALFDLCRRHPGQCVPMMGLHPTSVNDNPHWREELALAERYLTAPPEGIARFCAVGEIGLDYYWSGEFVAEQVEAFVSQCRLAARLGLPVAIHTRAAWDDMCRIIGEEATAAAEAGRRLRGVFHAFSEDAVTYRKLKACGDFAFGIGGVVTFRKSKLADTVREMELDDIVLETDCPYLTPAPHRGERNESAYVRFVCEKVAELKGLPPGEVAAATTANAKRIFGI